MDLRSTKASWAVGLCLASVTLVGCAVETTGRSAGSRQASSTPEKPVRDIADTKACGGAEAVIGHIAVDTSRWRPGRHPFDKTVSVRLASRANDLAAQGPLASNPQIRTAVGSTAQAFADVAGAMNSRKRAKVDHAIVVSRVAYKDLKQVCEFDSE